VLLIHGELDYRCPIEQSEQLFVVLRRLGREAVFLRFPGESHGLATAGRPDRRVARLAAILDWLAGHP
jgi:dipeptidyl aminopeptidase/acylaminoacyl peptidase